MKNKIILNILFIFIFIKRTHAMPQYSILAPQPNKSVGVESSDVYSIKSIYLRLLDLFVMWVDVIAAFGILLGILYVAYGLVNIRNIEAGKKQGNSTAQLIGIFISLFLIAIVSWTFFGADLLSNFMK